MVTYIHIHLDGVGVWVADVVSFDEAQELCPQRDLLDVEAGSVIFLDDDNANPHSISVVEIPILLEQSELSGTF